MSAGARACGSEAEERWPSSVSHSAGARGGETMEAVLHVIGLGWAPVHMGNAQCLVCFKRLQCWTPSLSFLSLSVVSWEMWKWFYRWIPLRFFWEGWLLPSPLAFLFQCLLLHRSVRHLITFWPFFPIQGEFATKEWHFLQRMKWGDIFTQRNMIKGLGIKPDLMGGDTTSLDERLSSHFFTLTSCCSQSIFL